MSSSPDSIGFQEDVKSINEIEIKANKNFRLDLIFKNTQYSYGFSGAYEKSFEDSDYLKMYYFFNNNNNLMVKNSSHRTSQSEQSSAEEDKTRQIIPVNKICTLDGGDVEITIKDIILSIDKINVVLKGKDPDGTIGKKTEIPGSDQALWEDGYIKFKIGKTVVDVKHDCVYAREKCTIKAVLDLTIAFDMYLWDQEEMGNTQKYFFVDCSPGPKKKILLETDLKAKECFFMASKEHEFMHFQFFGDMATTLAEWINGRIQVFDKDTGEFECNKIFNGLADFNSQRKCTCAENCEDNSIAINAMLTWEINNLLEKIFNINQTGSLETDCIKVTNKTFRNCFPGACLEKK